MLPRGTTFAELIPCVATEVSDPRRSGSQTGCTKGPVCKSASMVAVAPSTTWSWSAWGARSGYEEVYVKECETAPMAA